MVNILEYDENKLLEDEKEIKEISKNIRKESKDLSKELHNATLLKLLNCQDKLMNDLSRDYEILTDICKDLLHITDCIENSRKNYNLCEEKISDLLDKIKI